MLLPRRGLLELIAGGTAALSTPALSRRMPPDRPHPPASAADAQRLWARLVADFSGKPVFFYTHGNVWGFRPQADDLSIEQFARRVYGYSGVAARRLIKSNEGGWSIQQKFWAFYRDPETDAITDRILNPYTGRIDTARPLSGPSSLRPLGSFGGDAAPFNMRVRTVGPSAVVETSALSRFKPADTSWYKLEANLEDYVCATPDLEGRGGHVPSRYSQSLVAEWQTWTGMHGQPGHILFKGNGLPLRHLEDIPSDQLEAIDRHFPGTLTELRDWV